MPQRFLEKTVEAQASVNTSNVQRDLIQDENSTTVLAYILPAQPISQISVLLPEYQRE